METYILVEFTVLSKPDFAGKGPEPDGCSVFSAFSYSVGFASHNADAKQVAIFLQSNGMMHP